MKCSILVQTITLSISASSWKKQLLIPQSWFLVTCHIHTMQFRPLFYIVITQESPQLRSDTAPVGAQRSHPCLHSQGCWSAPGSGSVSAASGAVLGALHREASPDTWFLTTDRCLCVLSFRSKMIVSLDLCHLDQIWDGSRMGLKVNAHFSIASLMAWNWTPVLAGFTVNPL